MKNIKTIKSGLIAALFLASLLGVYGTSLLCDSYFIEQIDVTHSHEDGHHENEIHHGQKHSHENEEGSTDDCCKDLVYSFFSTSKLLIKHVQIKGSDVSASDVIQKPIILNLSLDLADNTSFYIDPPPKAIQKRILFQSFLI